jgi:O-antigen ligase
MVNLKNINRFTVLNFLFCLFPVIIAFGNLFTNLHFVIIILLGSFIFKKQLLIVEKNYFNIFFYLFFFIIIIFSFINYFDFNSFYFIDNESKSKFFKSLFFLRYLLIFIILQKLIECNEFKIKYFYFIAASITLFLIIDIIFQAIFGFDIFGLKTDISYRRLSGFFGEEYIAGGFLQRFSLYLIFLFPFLSFKNKSKYTKIFFIITSLLVFSVIVLTNNRMPIFLFILSFCFFFLFYKKFRSIFYIPLLLFLFSFMIIFNFSTRIQNMTEQFQEQAIEIAEVFLNIEINSNSVVKSDYAKLYNSAIDVYKKKKLVGNGIKSFRSICFKNLEKLPPYRSCNNHPHNYYLEILISFGLIGFFLFILIFIISIKNFLSMYYKIPKYEYQNKLILLIPFILLLTELFPIRSSGAFFTTNNATIIFVLFSIVTNLKINHIKNS